MTVNPGATPLPVVSAAGEGGGSLSSPPCAQGSRVPGLRFQEGCRCARACEKCREKDGGREGGIEKSDEHVTSAEQMKQAKDMTCTFMLLYPVELIPECWVSMGGVGGVGGGGRSGSGTSVILSSCELALGVFDGHNATQKSRSRGPFLCCSVGQKYGRWRERGDMSRTRVVLCTIVPVVDWPRARHQQVGRGWRRARASALTKTYSIITLRVMRKT